MLTKVVLVSSMVFSIVPMNLADICLPPMARSIPRLKYLEPREMASYIRAYRKHFTSVPRLLNTQDEEGNTLLHTVLQETNNVALFEFLYTKNASIDIENKNGLTVRRLLAMRSCDDFTKIVFIPTLP